MEYNRHMTRDHVEVEAKYSVTAEVSVPSFDDLPGVATVDPPETQDLAADYFDTDDFRLARLGITLHELDLPLAPGHRTATRWPSFGVHAVVDNFREHRTHGVA